MYRAIVTNNIAFIKDTIDNLKYFSQFNKQMLSTNNYSLDNINAIIKFMIEHNNMCDEQVMIIDKIPDRFINNKKIIQIINDNVDMIFPEVLCFCDNIKNKK